MDLLGLLIFLKGNEETTQVRPPQMNVKCYNCSLCQCMKHEVFDKIRNIQIHVVLWELCCVVTWQEKGN